MQNVCFSLGFPILFVNSCFCLNIVAEGILEPNLRQLGSSKVVKSAPRAAKRPSRGAQERPRAAQERLKSSQERPKSGPRSAQEQPRAAQERSKSGQETPKGEPDLQDELKSGQGEPKTASDPPKGAPRPPRPPLGPSLNAPQEAPRSHQERSTCRRTSSLVVLATSMHLVLAEPHHTLD